MQRRVQTRQCQHELVISYRNSLTCGVLKAKAFLGRLFILSIDLRPLSSSLRIINGLFPLWIYCRIRPLRVFVSPRSQE